MGARFPATHAHVPYQGRGLGIGMVNAHCHHVAAASHHAVHDHNHGLFSARSLAVSWYSCSLADAPPPGLAILMTTPFILGLRREYSRKDVMIAAESSEMPVKGISITPILGFAGKA